jgi:hypothetical protein
VKLLDRPNLIEADLQGFFNNVTLDGITIELAKIGFPLSEINFMRKLNMSIVKLPKEQLIEESNVDIIQNNTVHTPMFFGRFEITSGHASFNDILFHGSLEKANAAISKKGKEEVVQQGNPIFLHLGKFQITSKGQPSLNDINHAKAIGQEIHRKEIGVPQGASTSCSLSTLALRHLEDKTIVMYADDII